MCRTGGRRCDGGVSATRANMRARQRLSRARKALRAARRAGDQEALEVAARRFQEAQEAVRQSVACTAGDVTSEYDAAGPGALVVPAGEPLVVRRLSGETAFTDLLEFGDGTRVVRKDHARLASHGEDDVVAYSDAEELAPAVLAAVGLRAPAVRRTGRDVIHIEYVDGQSGEDLAGWGRDIPADVRDSADGRALGLADTLLANGDRNAGNWIRTGDGRLVGIDHGSAFWSTDTTNSPFAQASYTRTELTELGEQLEALRPEFDRRGRGDWHAAMMQRHQALTAATEEQKR